MERMVQQRFSGLPENTGVLPELMSGLQQHRTTVDSISCLVSSLEDARGTHHPGYMVFLDMHCAFKALPHGTNILHLQYRGVCSCILLYLRSFLSNRNLRARVATFLNRPREVAQGVTLEAF